MIQNGLNRRILSKSSRLTSAIFAITALAACHSSIKTSVQSGRSAKAAVNPTATPSADEALSGLAIASSSDAPYSTQTFSLTATGTYGDGSTKDLTSAVTWSSSSTAIAVSSTGSAIITASYREFSSTKTLSVGIGDLKSIFVVSGTGANHAGAVQQMIAWVYTPQDVLPTSRRV